MNNRIFFYLQGEWIVGLLFLLINLLLGLNKFAIKKEVKKMNCCWIWWSKHLFPVHRRQKFVDLYVLRHACLHGEIRKDRAIQ